MGAADARWRDLVVRRVVPEESRACETLPTMTTLYVREDGDDDNSGSVPAFAKRTIKAAVDASTPGDEIDIGPGEFRVTDAVAIAHALTLRGAGMDQTVVRGCADYGHQFLAASTEPLTGLCFSDMTLDVRRRPWDYASRRTCIRVERVHGLRVERVRFERPSAWGLVVGCGPISGTDDETATIYNRNVVVRGCDFVGLRPQERSGFDGRPRGSTLEQLLIFNAAGVLVEDCMFRDVPPSASGLGLYQAVEDAVVRRCTFDGIGAGAYYPITGRDISFAFCRFYGGSGILGARETDHCGLHGTSLAAEDLRVLGCEFECRENAAALEIGAVHRAWVLGCSFVGCLGPSVLINRGRDLCGDAPFTCDEVYIHCCAFFDAGRFGEFAPLQGGIYVARHDGETLHGAVTRCRFERLWREDLMTDMNATPPDEARAYPWLYALVIERADGATGGTLTGFTNPDNEYLTTTAVDAETGQPLTLENVVPLVGMLA